MHRIFSFNNQRTASRLNDKTLMSRQYNDSIVINQDSSFQDQFCAQNSFVEDNSKIHQIKKRF